MKGEAVGNDLDQEGKSRIKYVRKFSVLSGVREYLGALSGNSTHQSNNHFSDHNLMLDNYILILCYKAQ